MARVRLATEELSYLKAKLKPGEQFLLVLVKISLMRGKRSDYVDGREAYQ